jgi:hypothetical protein
VGAALQRGPGAFQEKAAALQRELSPFQTLSGTLQQLFATL